MEWRSSTIGFHKVMETGSALATPPVTRAIPASETDHRVRDLVDRGQVSNAAELLLATYGPDVFGFLAGVLDNATLARAAYKSVATRVIAELPSFQWTWSPQVWLYSIARRELDERRNRSSSVGPDEAADTEVWRHAGLIAVISAVRRILSQEERELLILRIDRHLDWHSIALTQLGEAATFPQLVEESRRIQTRVENLLERIETLTAQHLRRG